MPYPCPPLSSVLSCLLMAMAMANHMGIGQGTTTATFGFVQALSVSVCPSACDYSSISDAVNAAAQPNTTILVWAGTYVEASKATVSVPIVITAMGGIVQVDGAVASSPWLNITSSLVLNGSFVLNNAGISLYGGTWNQRGDVNITVNGSAATGLAVGVATDALRGGTWVQDGNVYLNVTATSWAAIGVILSGPTNWSQNGNLDLVVSGSQYNAEGVSLGEAAAWKQEGNTRASATNYATCVSMSGGVWTQNGRFNMTVSQNTGYGLSLYGGTWSQNGDSYISTMGFVNRTFSITAKGAIIYASGTWLQNGRLSIRAISNSYGLTLQGGGTWAQVGEVDIQATEFSLGVYFNSGTSTWTQSGSLSVNVSGTATGVQFAGAGTWLQGGHAQVHCDSGYGVAMVYGGGSWTQTGHLMATGRYCVYFYGGGGTWRQVGNVDAAGGEIVVLGGGGVWQQEGNVTIVLSRGETAAVMFGGDDNEWDQTGSLAISMTDSSSGVLFSGGINQTWVQNGSVAMVITGNASCGINLNDQGQAPWLQIGPAPTFDISTGSGSQGICPPPLPGPSVRVIQARFNQTAPSVIISPTQATEEEAQDELLAHVRFDFLGLDEIAPNGTVVQSVSLLNGGWQAKGDATSNDTTLFESSLVGGSTDAGTLTYMFSTFGNATVITLANNYSFKASPQYLKFSLRLSSWGWTSAAHRLRLRIGVHPPFNDSERRDSTPQRDMTTLLLRSADSTQASALVRLLAFGLVESKRVNCSINADADSSSFTVTFDHFGNSSLEYDPDLSLLLGQPRGSGSQGGTSAALIVGVAVAVPVAVMAAVAIVCSALAIAYVRERRNRRAGVVNFDLSDAAHGATSGPESDDGQL